MDLGALGVTSVGFWATTGLGVALTVPLTSGRARWMAIAALNLGFLCYVQRGWVVLTIGLLVTSYAAVCGVARSRRPGAFLAASLAVAGLFVVYKSPSLSVELPGRTALWLATFGYSYVALRLYDELVSVRDREEAPTFIEHVNYLVPFHMLAAGPIQRFEDFRNQPKVADPLPFGSALAAIERIVLGLFKKLVVAHVIERVFLTGFQSTGWYYVLEVHLFLPWLYLDFSSYSDVAVGVGRLLGQHTPENFDRPYLARDMVDFWQRWHISLSQWIRRHVFLPCQLFIQRRGTGWSPLVTSSLSLLVAFGLCGLWHAVSWRYGLWGLMHAVGVIVANANRTWQARRLGRARYAEYLKRPLPRLLGTLVTFELVAWSLSIVGGR